MIRPFSRRASETAFLLLVAILAGCETPTTATTLRDEPKAATRVETVRVERRDIRRSVDEPGQVEAFEVTEIHAKIAGYVRAWHVNIGSQIKKGQLLAELDVPEIDAELEQRKAEIAQAESSRVQSEAAAKVARAAVATAEAKLVESKAGIKRATADLARWQAEHKRVDQLFRDRAQTGSLLDETLSKLQAAESAREEIDAQVLTAQAGIVQSRAALDKTTADLAAAATGVLVAKSAARRVEALLSYAKIVAPFDGIVVRRNVDTGDLTIPGAQSEPLFVVARSDLSTVAVGVPELFAAAIDPGDRAIIRIQALPSRVFEGKVARTAYALSAKSRTLRAEIDLPNGEGKILPGLYAYASIIVEERMKVLSLPNSSLFMDGPQAFCVVARDGRALRKPIKIGLSDGVWTEIVSGLDGDEAVVKANAAGLAHGQSIQAIDPAKLPPPGVKP